MFFLRLMEGGPHLVAQTCNRREWIKNYKTKRSADMIPVRCNPEVAPRLTSGGYEDKVDVFTPISILFRGGGKLCPLMKIKLMLQTPVNILFRGGWQILM